jgi:parallel beta-helix repeat protein
LIRKTAALLGFILVTALLGQALPANAQIVPDILQDFGDAPATYDAGADGPARHLIDVPGLVWMGDLVLGFDPDGGAQNGPTATDDDCHTAEGAILPIGICFPPLPELLSDGNNYILDDEDGVAISGLVPGGQADVSVNTTGSGFFSGWVDFNHNGFFDVAERVFDAVPVSGGQNVPLHFAVPINVLGGETFARFRISNAAAGIHSPVGDGGSGEVEDYRVAIAMDLGDAPNDANHHYPVIIADDGARHLASPANNPLRFGAGWDTDPDGQPDPNSAGDDNDADGDDEDGITFFGPLVQNTDAPVNINANATGKVDAWVDFNHDGDWNDVGEKVFTAKPVVAGNNATSFHVPLNATVGPTFTRWRITTNGVAAPTGAVNDGEVEDHAATISAPAPLPMDFGDAPDGAPGLGYPTALAHNGARHLVNSTDVRMGPAIDTEADSLGNASATLDDTTGTTPDDEDGVTFRDHFGAPTVFVPGLASEVKVNASTVGILDAWVDANHDEDWEDVDENEHIIDSEVLAPGDNFVSFTMPPGGTFGATFARFRFSTSGQNAPEGFVNDGEVEDYQVDVTLECGAIVLNNPATGEFDLPFNLNCPGTGNSPFGLFAGADKTIIDLNGHTISGDGVGADTGIANTPFLPRTDDVVVKNGNVDNFGVGVQIIGHRTRIEDAAVEINHGHGIDLTGDDTHLEDVDVNNNQGDGVRNTGHIFEAIRVNATQNDDSGIDFIGSDGVIDASTADENGIAGVRGDGNQIEVTNSSLSANKGDGVHLTGEDGFVSGNTIDDNLGYGVLVDGGPRNRVNGNLSVSENHLDGILIGGDFTQVLNNLAIDRNFGDGIRLISGIKFLIKNNVALENNDDGIEIQKAARGGKVTRNTLRRDNGDWAIFGHKKVRGAHNRGFPCHPAFLCD